MFRLNKVLTIFLLCLIPFVFYSSVDLLIDGDSYFYLNQVCTGEFVFQQLSVFPFWIYFFPCSILFVKIYLFLIYFSSVLVVSKIGEEYDKEHGWLVGLTWFGFTFAIIEFWKFENDGIGYLLGLLGFLWLIRGKTKGLVLSVIYFILSGLFWNGVVYWLFFSAPFFYLGYGVSILFPIVLSESFWWFLFPNPLISEHQSWVVLAWIGVALFFFVGVLKTDKKIILAFFGSLLPALFVSKLFVLCTPFVALISFNGLKVIGDLKVLRIAVVIFCLLMAVMFGFWTQSNFPKMSDIDLVKKGLSYSNELNNDFSVGYIIEFYGGVPSGKGFITDYNYTNYTIGLSKNGANGCLVLEDNNRFVLLDCSSKK